MPRKEDYKIGHKYITPDRRRRVITGFHKCSFGSGPYCKDCSGHPIFSKNKIFSGCGYLHKLRIYKEVK
jgi:hypothetical protein